MRRYGVLHGLQPLMCTGVLCVDEETLSQLESSILDKHKQGTLSELGPPHQYQATLAGHDSVLQKNSTCRMSKPDQFEAFTELAGALALWREVGRMYPFLSVKYLDLLVQDIALNGASAFTWHEDVERLRGGQGPANRDAHAIWVTVVVKLSLGQSAMQVAGCDVTEYPTARGAFAAFRASAMHRSLAARSLCVKAVFFLGPN